MRRALSILAPIGLPVLGVVVVILATVVGLGWAVRSQPSSVERVVGFENLSRLDAAYLRAMSGLLPRDADGDGVCDGIELWRGTDPHNPRQHPALDLLWDRDGLEVFDSEMFFTGRNPKSAMNTTLLPHPGQRLRLRGRMLLENDTHFFPRSFRLRVKPAADARLALPGETPATGDDLLVPINVDGSFAFDLQIPADAVPDPQAPDALQVDNPVNGEHFASLAIRCVWKQPVLRPSVENVPLDTLPLTGGKTLAAATDRVSRLRWSPLIPPADLLLVECARDQSDAEWFPVHTYPRTNTSCLIAQCIAGQSKPYDGPVKFRVIPILFRPPESPTLDSAPPAQ